MARTSLLLLLALFALPAAAADLGRFADWPASPVSYFMTAADRGEWAKLRTEEEAAAFVARYLESRGGDRFVSDVNERAARADQYLSLGKTAGSRSLRGRVVILLGPPESVSITIKQTRGGRSSNPPSGAVTSKVRGTGAGYTNYADVAGREAMDAGREERIFTFTYPQRSIVVEANEHTGRDRVDRKTTAALEKMFEAAAQASIVSR